MGMTLTEKILAAHTGTKKVSPGELVNAKVDLVLGNDITSPLAIKETVSLPCRHLPAPLRYLLEVSTDWSCCTGCDRAYVCTTGVSGCQAPPLTRKRAVNVMSS